MKEEKILICFAAAFLSCLVLQTGCAKKKPSLPEQPALKAEDAPSQGIAQKILSFNLEGYRDNGEKKWELKGSSANILSNVIVLDYITATAYGDDTSATLRARKGVYDKVTKNVHLEGNVVGKSSDGTRLVTEKLDWNQDTESVTTNAIVKIDKDNLFSTGKGARGSPQLKQVELKKDVVVEIKDETSTIITCDGPLVVDYGKNISTLNNNVKITDQRGQITADVMKILFDQKTRKITRVVAIGSVRIQREGNSTYSDRAVYTVRDGRTRLVGKPKIVVFPKEAKEKKNAPIGDKKLN